MTTRYKVTVTKVESEREQKYKTLESGSMEPTGEWMENITETIVYSQDFDPSPSPTYRTAGTDECRVAFDKWLQELIQFLNGVGEKVNLAEGRATENALADVTARIARMDERLTKGLSRLVRKVSPMTPVKKKARKS